MSEINIGDIVLVYGYDCIGDYYDGEKGKVIEFLFADKKKTKVELKNKGIRVTPITVHSKQCRPFVKRIKVK